MEGKSNQIARAASMQVASNPCGTDNNPLFIYGGVGLGKTHLMHAIGNRMLEENLNANVVYLHSEQFVGEMVTALQHNRINEFQEALSVGGTRFSLMISSSSPARKRSPGRIFFHTFKQVYSKENGSLC